MSTSTHGVSEEVKDDLEVFLRRYYEDAVAELANHYPREQRSITVEFNDLLTYDAAIADDFLERPMPFGTALDDALQRYDLPSGKTLEDAHARVTGLNDERTFDIGEYDPSDIGEYIAVEGQIGKASSAKPELERAYFECQRCGYAEPIEQHGDDITEPHECGSCERKGPFELDPTRSDKRSHRMLRLQQPPEQSQGGQGPSIDIHLRDDLARGARNVPSFSPGDRVTVTGRYTVAVPDSGRDLREMIVAEDVGVEQTEFEEIDVSEHMDAIEAIASGDRGDPLDLFVESLAPKIQGYEEIKRAIILQLFGGVQVEYPDGSVERGDSHILLLGDPGTAKSSLLRAVEEIAPRSTYASGKGASAAGLTAAAVPDDFGDSKWSLEAGALVLANNGIACIDEIDKIQEDAVQSMHDALEDQRVPINKAGINTILPAETSLLAAGNPMYGRFDPMEAIADQIDLGPTLLSRFDLMFMLNDDPDAEEDRDIIGSMIQNRRTAIDYMENRPVDQDDLAEIQPAIDPEVFRAYIAHAKQTVTPRVSDDVERHLQEFVAELRQGDEDGPVPVTLRKVEAIERLAEASARARLDDEVTIEDARRATRLVTRSMRDVGLDPETGEFDADIIETGTSYTQHNRQKLARRVIDRLDENDGAPVDDVIETMMGEGVTENRATKAIEKMLDNGTAFRLGNGECIKLTSSY